MQKVEHKLASKQVDCTSALAVHTHGMQSRFLHRSVTEFNQVSRCLANSVWVLHSRLIITLLETPFGLIISLIFYTGTKEYMVSG
jgi:hypothetical protein